MEKTDKFISTQPGRTKGGSVKSLNISDIFTPEGIKELRVGQLLRFEKAELIITKMNRKSGKVYAKETKTFTPEEIERIEKERSNN